MGTAALLVMLAFIFGGGGGDEQNGLDNNKRVPNDNTRPYPLPRPYAASATVCYRTKEPYNAAILGTPEQVVALLNWLGVKIGRTELLQADAAATTPVFAESAGYAAVPSVKLKMVQAVGRSIGLRGYKNAPAKSVDGIWGECTALVSEDLATLKEQGKMPPL